MTKKHVLIILAILSVFVVQAQEKNGMKTICGQFEIQQNGEKVKPVFLSNVDGMMIYHLGADIGFGVDTIDLDLISHQENMQSYLLYYDANGNTTWWYKMESGKRYVFGVCPEKKGAKEYMCLLYSIEDLNITNLIYEINNIKGNLYRKIQSALGDKLVPHEDIRFVMNEIEFSARSKKTVVPVFIEILH